VSETGVPICFSYIILIIEFLESLIPKGFKGLQPTVISCESPRVEILEIAVEKGFASF
jgi:hypothetical protein